MVHFLKPNQHVAFVLGSSEVAEFEARRECEKSLSLGLNRIESYNINFIRTERTISMKLSWFASLSEVFEWTFTPPSLFPRHF